MIPITPVRIRIGDRTLAILIDFLRTDLSQAVGHTAHRILRAPRAHDGVLAPLAQSVERQSHNYSTLVVTSEGRQFDPAREHIKSPFFIQPKLMFRRPRPELSHLDSCHNSFLCPFVLQTFNVTTTICIYSLSRQMFFFVYENNT